MSVVYLAEDLRLKRSVLLKLLAADRLRTDGTLERTSNRRCRKCLPCVRHANLQP